MMHIYTGGGNIVSSKISWSGDLKVLHEKMQVDFIYLFMVIAGTEVLGVCI